MGPVASKLFFENAQVQMLFEQGMQLSNQAYTHLGQASRLELAQIVVSLVLGFILFKICTSMLRRRRMGNIPCVKGGLPYIGNVLSMLKGSPWDTMTHWVAEYGEIFTFHLFGSDALCVSDPVLLREILQTKLGSFKKDTGGTYKPFMVILGGGLVTS